MEEKIKVDGGTVEGKKRKSVEMKFMCVCVWGGYTYTLDREKVEIKKRSGLVGGISRDNK